MKFSIYLCLILHLTLLASKKEYFLSLENAGSVRYIFDDNIILHIERLSPSHEIMYRHSYVYDETGGLAREKLIGNLGDIVYEKPGIVKSPYHLEICKHDTQDNVMQHIQDDCVRKYAYNDNVLISNKIPQEVCEYDVCGNLIRKGDTHFCYDEANRLTQVISTECDITYIYNNQGRRIARISNGELERFGFFGINEIAVFDENGSIKELRIPGLSPHKDLLRPIAIETQDAVYAPIHDIQNNIVKLINITTKEQISLNLPEPFGENLSPNAPTRWIFSGKPYDKEANLIYFGHRYYSPDLHQWLSIDPAYQTSDLYQYCFNNPLKYFDPDGQFVIAIPLIWIGGAALTEVLIDAALVGSAAWLGHKAIKKGNEWADRREVQRNKKGSIDPNLPANPDELLKRPGWKETTHPNARKKGHRSFENQQTGEKLRYDQGKSGETGHRGHDHYHKPNPNNTNGRHDKYLDGKGNPVPDESDASHIYHPDKVWWNS